MPLGPLEAGLQMGGGERSFQREVRVLKYVITSSRTAADFPRLLLATSCLEAHDGTKLGAERHPPHPQEPTNLIMISHRLHHQRTGYVVVHYFSYFSVFSSTYVVLSGLLRVDFFRVSKASEFFFNPRGYVNAYIFRKKVRIKRRLAGLLFVKRSKTFVRNTMKPICKSTSPLSMD